MVERFSDFILGESRGSAVRGRNEERWHGRVGIVLFHAGQAFAIAWQKGGQIDQRPDISGPPFRRFGNDDTAHGMADQDYRFTGLIQNAGNGPDICIQGYAVAGRGVSTMSGQIRGNDRMPGGLQQRDDFVPAPCPVPGAVYQYECGQFRRLPACDRRLLVLFSYHHSMRFAQSLVLISSLV